MILLKDNLKRNDRFFSFTLIKDLFTISSWYIVKRQCQIIKNFIIKKPKIIYIYINHQLHYPLKPIYMSHSLTHYGFENFYGIKSDKIIQYNLILIYLIALVSSIVPLSSFIFLSLFPFMRKCQISTLVNKLSVSIHIHENVKVLKKCIKVFLP